MTEKEIGVEQARGVLGKLVDDAAVDGQVTYLTRRGRRYAAIVPISLVPQEPAMSDSCSRCHCTHNGRTAESCRNCGCSCGTDCCKT